MMLTNPLGIMMMPPSGAYNPGYGAPGGGSLNRYLSYLIPFIFFPYLTPVSTLQTSLTDIRSTPPSITHVFFPLTSVTPIFSLLGLMLA